VKDSGSEPLGHLLERRINIDEAVRPTTVELLWHALQHAKQSF